MTDHIAPAWARRPEEPEPHHLAFIHYLTQAVDGGERSIAETARVTGSRPMHVADWAKTHQWRERARAFDASAAVTVLDDLRAQRADFIRRHMSLSTTAQSVAERALQHISDAQDRHESDPDVEAPVIRATDVKALADMAAAAERHVVVMTSPGPGGAPSAEDAATESVDTSRIMSDPALLAQALDLADALDK